ncbi:MAG: hypothetical protein ACYDAE_00530 [Steroidobacteraceae bacterium]
MICRSLATHEIKNIGLSVVAAAAERDEYIRRWVHYNQGVEQAAVLWLQPHSTLSARAKTAGRLPIPASLAKARRPVTPTRAGQDRVPILSYNFCTTTWADVRRSRPSALRLDGAIGAPRSGRPIARRTASS